ncbi:MAG: ABC transporter permease [Methylophilus sp.]
MRLSFKLACQQLVANWRAGDLRVLLMALILSIAAITAVNAFSQRVLGHLTSQGSILLGGDLVIKSDHVLNPTYESEARSLGLKVTQTAEFPSMLIAHDLNHLAEIKALGSGFPLRGDFDVQFSKSAKVETVSVGPKPGEVWLGPRLINLLNIKIGEVVELGAKTFKVAGVLSRESSRGGDMFSFAPRVMMHLDDLPATQLVQYGSRVKYQLIIAGDRVDVNRYSASIKSKLNNGEHLEDVKTARPEIKSALDKAEIFLGLSAMVSVILAIVAMLLSSGPFVSRNLDTFAMLRCFGGSNQFVQRILIWQTLLVAVVGGVLGALLGYLLQEGLATLAGSLLVERLAPLSFKPFVFGFVISILVMIALMWPHLQAIKRLSIVSILRRDVEINLKQDALNYVPMVLLVLALIFLHAKTVKLALLMSLGLVATTLVVAVFAYMVVHLLFRVSFKQTSQLNFALQLGLSNLKRHLRLSLAQMIAFSLALMVIVLLTIVRTDLMQSWRDSLPANAPNRFVINLQKNQIDSFKQHFEQNQLAVPEIFPMVRGRLVAINQKQVNSADYEDERAKRLIAREFNLSMTEKMQKDNRLIDGKWWSSQDAGQPIVSIEQDIATNLNIHVGDTLTYDIAGTLLKLTVTSIRKVEWDTMRANFFAVTPPKVLDPFLASYMTAFYLPQSKAAFIDPLVKQFNNLTVIDVAAIMGQVRDIMQKMTMAVSYVFLFSLFSGLAILYAALVATKSSRVYEATLLRALGATRRQVGMAMIAEFFCIAAVAIVVSLVLANLLAYGVSHYLLDIRFHLNLSIVLLAFSIAILLIPLAAWLVVRHYLNQPPKQLLNSI